MTKHLDLKKKFNFFGASIWKDGFRCAIKGVKMAYIWRFGYIASLCGFVSKLHMLLHRPKLMGRGCDSMLTIWLSVPYWTIGGNNCPILPNEMFGLRV